MDPTAIKDLFAGAYRGNPVVATICIYGFFAILAVVTHLTMIGISKPSESGKPAPISSTTVINQTATDTDCSNNVATQGSAVTCTADEQHNDKKPHPKQ